MNSYKNDLKSLLSTCSGRYEYARWLDNALETVKKDGLSLKDKSQWWTENEQIVEAAIDQNPLAIRYAPAFQDNKKMALIAVRLNGLARFWLSSNLQKDEEISQIALKNLPREYKGAKSGIKTIFLPDDRCNQLKKIEESDIFNKIFPFKLEKNECSRFVRDSHVNLFKNKHLIPYPIKDPLVHHYLLAILPLSAKHFFYDIEKNVTVFQGLTGKGFYQTNVEQAMVIDYDQKISFKLGNSCIEGGNCFLFYSNQQKKAIIGEISLYLSLIAFEEQGYFKEINIDETKAPSLESLRMARNLEYYHTKKMPIEEKRYIVHLKKLQDFEENPFFSSVPMPKKSFTLEEIEEELEKLGGELGYRRRLVAPLTEEEKIKFCDEGKRIDKKLEMTKLLIAKELNIPLEHIAFIPQSNFHIDMEMFVTPKGEVILHDDFEAKNFLRAIQESYTLEKEEQSLLNEYFLTAEEEGQMFKDIQIEKMRILSNCNISYKLFPAIFKAKVLKSYLNYCNGIFVDNGFQFTITSQHGKDTCFIKTKGHSFITTGPSKKAEEIFHNEFIKLFKRTFPNLGIQLIPNMSEFLAKYDGGIHCLTFENTL